MKFTTAIFNRSITIELMNHDIYEMQQEASVYINDKKVLVSKKNVFSLHGLLPDTDYSIRIECGGESETETIHTRKESVLLNVKEFGAAGDGQQNDAAQIQAAVLACPKNGTVYIPRGTYFVTPIFLKSHMTLWVDEDAVLLGDPERSHYPILPGMVQGTDESEEYSFASWEGNPLSSFASLITAIDCEHVDIIGPGTLNGNADASDWWVDCRIKRQAWRPNVVFLNHCTHIRMQNLVIKNSPCWTVHPYYSDDLLFLNLNIQNPYHTPNTDGFDPESCQNVLMLGTKISVGDDCIAIKSGKYYMAQNHFKRTENVVIRNCFLERGHGSVTVGSEIAGGVAGVHVEQCLFDATDRGVRIKTRRGRGERSLLDEISFDRIMMRNVHMPVTVNMFYFCDPDGHTDHVQNTDEAPVTKMTPKIGRISIKNTVCTGTDSSFLCAYGLKEMPIEEIDIENVDVSFLPHDQMKEDRPVMMDHFEPIKGVSIWAANVKKLSMHHVNINGALQKEAVLQNVEDQDFTEVTSN